MSKRLIQSFLPWVIFFICFGYDELILKIGASGALVALILLDKQNLKRGFIFDWGTLLFFVFIFATVIVFYQPWVAGNASLLANSTLTLIAWLSLFINKPFTMQYAKLTVAKEYWQTSLFRHMNLWLTSIWAVVFTLMTILEIAEIYHAKEWLWFAEIIPLGLIVFAVCLTMWFPEWYKTKKIGRGGLLNLSGLSDLKIITTDSAQMSYRMIGKGMPLLLLPNAQMSMYAWDTTLIKLLAKRFQVILIDYPGINQSVMHSGEYTVEGLAKILLEFIAELQLDKVSIVGYSMGGWVAQSMAIAEPDKVENLVLIATDVGGSRATATAAEILDELASDMPNEQRQQLISRVIFPADVCHKYETKLNALYLSAGELVVINPAILKQQLKLANAWFAGKGNYQQLSKILANTLVMTGILDQVIHRQNSVVLANGISQAKLLEFPNAGHGIIYQCPEQIAEAIFSTILA